MSDSGRGKGRPRLAETAEFDQAIQTAALQVLAEHGDAATMQAIAKRAGLSRKSLYARYPNKEELFVQAIGELLTAVGSLEYDTSGDAAARLLHYIQAALDLLARPESQAFQRLLTMDPVYIARLRAEMLAAARKIFYEPLVALLEDGVAAGELEADNVDVAARLVIRLIFTERMGLAEESGAEVARSPVVSATLMAGLLLNGMRPRTRAALRP